MWHMSSRSGVATLRTAIHLLLFTFNLQTKFEMSSIIRSKDKAWAPKCRNELLDPDHSHLGVVQHYKLNISRGQVVYEI